MRWPWSPKRLTDAQVAGAAEFTRRQRREEALIDRMIEIDERRAIPCVDCEIGEPHVCERAWWQQKYDHSGGRECADLVCACHPVECDYCHQAIPWQVANR